MASAILPAELRTTGIAVLTTLVSLARLVASVLFGALWTWWSVQTAVLLFTGGLIVASLIAAFAFNRLYRETPIS